jgi:hemerythrin superfamily protein
MLTRKLVAHETAEQEVVHPLLKKAGDGSGTCARLTAEKEGEKALAELQKKGTEDPQFPALFASLKGDVLRHAEAEESEEHPKIRASVAPERLQSLGNAFKAAQKVAPTRPHPNAPTSAIGNLAVGPIAAVVDRARDAVRRSCAGEAPNGLCVTFGTSVRVR